MTGGEKRLARRLEAKLEDDYLVWYDVPVGSRGFHPDFIVLHPRRGLLVLEVKDWRLDTIRAMDRFRASILTARGLVKEANPLEQARGYACAMASLLQKDPALVAPTGLECLQRHGNRGAGSESEPVAFSGDRTLI